MTTIKDVAQHAGVSIASASYALNDTGTISQATRQRVLQAAKTLNYHPNAFARHLKNRKTCTIGVFVTRFGGSFYEEILEGIHDAVLKADYELIVCPESRTQQKMLVHRQVDGAIVFDSKIKSDTLLSLASPQFPIVTLDRDLAQDYLFPVLIDNEHGVREAFYHLYDQGARRLALIAGAMDSLDNAERMRAFLNAADTNRVPVQVYHGDFTEASGYAVAQGIIRAAALPEAIFCANDQMAIGFIKALKEHNLAAPDDVAVVGFDDIPIAQYMQPSLSTIGAPRFEWGAVAVTQLIAFLDHREPFSRSRLPTRLIPRQSSMLVRRSPQSAGG